MSILSWDIPQNFNRQQMYVVLSARLKAAAKLIPNESDKKDAIINNLPNEILYELIEETPNILESSSEEILKALNKEGSISPARAYVDLMIASKKPGETGSQYIARLEGLGKVFNASEQIIVDKIIMEAPDDIIRKIRILHELPTLSLLKNLMLEHEHNSRTDYLLKYRPINLRSGNQNRPASKNSNYAPPHNNPTQVSRQDFQHAYNPKRPPQNNQQ